MKTYLITYFNYLNEYTTCYANSNFLEECIKNFEKSFILDEEPLPEKYSIYELVYTK